MVQESDSGNKNIGNKHSCGYAKGKGVSFVDVIELIMGNFMGGNKHNGFIGKFKKPLGEKDFAACFDPSVYFIGFKQMNVIDITRGYAMHNLAGKINGSFGKRGVSLIGRGSGTPHNQNKYEAQPFHKAHISLCS